MPTDTGGPPFCSSPKAGPPPGGWSISWGVVPAKTTCPGGKELLCVPAVPSMLVPDPVPRTAQRGSREGRGRGQALTPLSLPSTSWWPRGRSQWPPAASRSSGRRSAPTPKARPGTAAACSEWGALGGLWGCSGGALGVAPPEMGVLTQGHGFVWSVLCAGQGRSVTAAAVTSHVLQVFPVRTSAWFMHWFMPEGVAGACSWKRMHELLQH